MDLGMHGYDHRDWHALAESEGVNWWDCPFGCRPDFDEDDEPDPPYAWVANPNLSGDYPVFSEAQATLYAETLAIRLDAPVTMRLEATGATVTVAVPVAPEDPLCPHGMSSSLCEDPVTHYGSD